MCENFTSKFKNVNHTKCLIWIFLAISTNFFFHFKITLSGNTAWPQTLLSKTPKIDHFQCFLHFHCIRSLLCSQCWMRLFLWLSRKYVQLLESVFTLQVQVSNMQWVLQQVQWRPNVATKLTNSTRWWYTHGHQEQKQVCNAN